MTTITEPAKTGTSKTTPEGMQALQDENKKLHQLLETLKAKLLKAELAVKDGKPASELKDMKEAILYVTPLGGPKNASQTKDMKDFYENLAASLAVPPKAPSKSTKSSSSGSETKSTSKKEVTTTGEESKTATSDKASTEPSAPVGDDLALADEFDQDDGGTSTSTKPKDTTNASSDSKALSSDDGQTVVVTSNEEPEDDSHRSSKKPPQQVCVVDLKNAEWWTLIDKEDAEEDENMYVDVKPDGTSADLNPDEDNQDDEFDEGPEEAFGEQYEVVKDDELASALSDYVSLSMKMYPEAKQVAPEEMKKMLDKAFGELKPKGTVARLWGWGQFAYTAYGWGQWVFRLYKEPALVKLVATGVWNAAQYAIVFVL